MTPSVSPQEVTGRVADALASFGAEPSDLYRALANNEVVAELWIRFAWGLREGANTPRALRELMILRAAQLQEADYVWRDHIAMASAAGVSEEQIDAVASWQSSVVFDEPTRACLALIEEMVGGQVRKATLGHLERAFSAEDRVELIVTAGFYCMVPRVLDALRLAPWSTVE
jgi:4-carboxymuconolactone decarboxylase